MGADRTLVVFLSWMGIQLCLRVLNDVGENGSRKEIEISISLRINELTKLLVRFDG